MKSFLRLTDYTADEVNEIFEIAKSTMLLWIWRIKVQF